MNLPKELTTVTPTSRYLAIFLFISLPFVGFLLGSKYEQRFTEYIQGRADIDQYILQNQPTATQSASTANWKTYRNEKYGFILKYPNGWIVEEYDAATNSVANANHVDFSDDTDENLTYVFRFGFIVYSNPSNLPLRDYLLQERVNLMYPLTLDQELSMQDIQSRVGALQDTVFKGYKALQDEQNTKLFVSVDENIFMFYMDSLNEEINSFVDFPFDQILSAFRFLD